MQMKISLLLPSTQRNSFWTSEILSQHHSSCQLWYSINTVFSVTDRFLQTATSQLNNFMPFLTKRFLQLVHQQLTLLLPDLSYAVCSFDVFRLVAILDMIHRLPDKQSITYPVSTSVIKKIFPNVAPVLTELCNSFLHSGQIPDPLKVCHVTSFLKWFSHRLT